MCQTTISVWFVCRLCRGSFGQVDAFIEHKKEKHFTQFQNINCIVFEERELDRLYTEINSGDHQLADEVHEPPIKLEVNDEDPINPFSSEIIDKLNLALVEVKDELINFECEIKPDNENDLFGLQPPEPNPYVRLKRLTFKEIQKACGSQHHSSLLKCEQKIFANNLDPQNSAYANRDIKDHSEVKKSTENEPPTAIVVNIFTEHVLQFECKLCSKQLQSEAQLKIHVGICALYHKDRKRFCVTCNRKFSVAKNLKLHRLRFHGTEEEKLSLFKFKCHVCSKQYRNGSDLTFHLESHRNKIIQQVKPSKSKLLKCSQPNCGTEFRWNTELQRHISAVHLGLRPFRCPFPNCKKTFSQRGELNIHFRSHTGERPYKCTVDNCNKAFRSAKNRSAHDHRTVHRHPNL